MDDALLVPVQDVVANGTNPNNLGRYLIELTVMQVPGLPSPRLILDFPADTATKLLQFLQAKPPNRSGQ
jgi:hypothetical protein